MSLDASAPSPGTQAIDLAATPLRALNEALQRCGVDTLVMELNSDTVRSLKAAGQPVLFADATHPEALDLAGISRARLVAFTFPSVDSTCAAAPLVRPPA